MPARANVASAARTAGVRCTVYPGDLQAGGGLAAHLASRQEVGRIPRFRRSHRRVPRVDRDRLRERSYAIVTALVEQLPVRLGLLAPVYRHLAEAMADSLRNETVVRTGAALDE